MTYTTNYYDVFRRQGLFIDKIFKGAKPGDLPVQQPTKFELMFNLKTAKALGLTIPPTLLALADEVVEYHPYRWGCRMAAGGTRANLSIAAAYYDRPVCCGRLIRRHRSNPWRPYERNPGRAGDC